MSSTMRLISDFLDESIDCRREHVDLIRVAKIQEEAGEAMQAMIAYQHVNPRKPAGPLDDVIKELADVALTALCAIEHFERDSMAILEARKYEVWRRLVNKSQ